LAEGLELNDSHIVIDDSRAVIDEAQRLRQVPTRFDQRTKRDVHSLTYPGQLFIIQQRQRALIKLLHRTGFAQLAEHRILEVGCGAGGVLREWLWLGARPHKLHGVELLDWRLREAQAATPHLPLLNADAQHLPYGNDSFDIVAQFTVFSSLLADEVRRAVAAEMRRVLRPGGLIIWYDFWLNPRNRQTRGLRPHEVQALFPDCRCNFQRITLAPPITRRLAPYSWLGCYLLEQARIFNTHFLAAIRPHSDITTR
jgi:SAM-dependent methyltransferase